MIPDVSIVLSCYKRGRQLRKTMESIAAQNVKPELIVVEDGDDGITQTIARQFGAKYFQRKRPDLPAFQNPSRIHNIGIRQATGNVVILQGGEVKYETKPNSITRLAELAAIGTHYVSPLVASYDRHDNFSEWYSHPTQGSRTWWIINFCLAVKREHLFMVGGFEETYTGYGFEDSQLMFCLDQSGLKAKYAEDVLVGHQWHSRDNYNFTYPEGQAQFDGFVADVIAGRRPPVSNNGKAWGQL